MRCQGCGHQNEHGANFCSRCGGPVGSSPTGVEADTTAMFPAIDLDHEDEAALAGLDPGQALLVIRRGPAAGTRFKLEGEVVMLGRHPDSDIFLNDVTVSRRHAEMRRDQNAFTLVDLGSLNGTYVNRERVERAPLRSGDELQVGKFRLMYLERQ